GAASTLPAWHQAAELMVPDADEITATCEALRSAAENEREETQRSDALAADRSVLLEQALKFHDQHGDQPCPVCERGTLDDRWAVAARAALDRQQSAAEALTAARAATGQARTALSAAVRSVPAPPLADGELTTLPAARA